MSWLRTQFQKNPEKLYIQHKNKKYTFLDLHDMVQIYTRALLKEGIKPGDRVVIWLPSEIEMIEVILSCFEIGAIICPLSRRFTDGEKNKILKILEPRLIITSWIDLELFIKKSYSVIAIEELLNSSGGCAVFNNSYKKNQDDICAIIQTSGTEGLPKSVQLTYGNFDNSCNNWNNFLHFQPSDQFLCCLPLNHIGGLAVLIRGLIFGFSVNVVSSFESKTILNTIEAHPISIISLVPTMLSRILAFDNGLEYLKSLRYILLGGGPSPKSLLNYCIKTKLPIIKVYGMTETCSGTCVLDLLKEPENKLYTGRPFPNTKIKIINNEIHISGPMVMQSYLGSETTNGIHNSHDLGYIEDNGLLFLDIRRKDLIISGGENVNPREIEENLVGLVGILDAAVVGISDNEWGQIVTAYIVVSNNEYSDKIIKLALSKKLANYKIPKKIIRVSSIPRNEIGKIIYSKLNS